MSSSDSRTDQSVEQSQRPLVHKWWMTLGTNPWSPWVVVCGFFVIRLVWQMVSPYTLAEDEAHYWEWSRHLDWSYYSKGPGVSWSIFLSTSVLGNTEFAVRLPALVGSTLGAVAIVKMAQIAYRDPITTFVSALLWFCVPGLAISAMVMTIDAPYTACWAWASYFAIRALIDEKPRSWIGFGLMIGIGFIFKYTILLLVPGAILGALLVKPNQLKIKWFVMGMVVSMIGLIPVTIWNANHDWATVRHLLGHLGAPGGDTENTISHKEPWTILWLIEYFALQFLVGGGVLMLAIFAIPNIRQISPDSMSLGRRSTWTLWLLAFPIFGFYGLVAMVTQTEGNWALAGFVSLIPCAAIAAIDGVRRKDHPVKFAWGASIVLGVSCLVLFPAASWASKRRVVGQYIPIHRMSGMREHADDAQRVIDELRDETGLEPLIMTEHYGRASQLAFYLEGHPTTYCISALVGGRKTQYDMWDSTDLSNRETLGPLEGRAGLLMGGRIDQWTAGFGQVREIGKLEMEPVDNRTSYIGYFFTNFDSWTPPKKLDKTN